MYRQYKLRIQERHDSIAKAVKFGKLVAMKHLVLTLPLIATVIGLGVVSCGSNAPTVIPQINSVKRSSYGTAPGGYVRLDPRMLRAMQTLAKEGYTFRVTSMAGASHSRTSRHYAGLAFDIDLINGCKVGSSSPHWRTVLKRCREMGATETLGPGDKGHSTHIHAAWPR